MNTVHWVSLVRHSTAKIAVALSLLTVGLTGSVSAQPVYSSTGMVCERMSLNNDWRFIKQDSPDVATNQLSYSAIRNWLLPTGNEFSTNAPVARPDGEPGGANYAFAQPNFDDS